MPTNLSLEKRHFRRKDVEGIQATIALGNGSSLRGTVDDIGPGGISLSVRRPLTFLGLTENDTEAPVQILQIGHHSCQANATLAWIASSSARNTRLGIRMHRPQFVLDDIDFRETSRQFDVLQSQEDLTDFLKDMILLSGDLPVHVNINGLQETGTFEHRTKLKKFDHLTIALPKGTSFKTSEQHPRALCSAEIFDTFYAFYADVVNIENETLKLSLPDKVVRLYRRALSRLSNPGDFELRMTTSLNSLETPASFRFFDLHETGGSILVSHDASPLPVGIVISNASLHAAGHFLTNVDVAIVAATPMDAGVLTQLQFKEESRHPISKFARTIIQKRYPKIKDAYANDFPRFWELLEESGYVGEREGGVIEQVQTQAKETWAHAMETQFGIARNFGIVNDGRFTGGAHLTQYYPDTWLFHQLAILPGKQGADMPLLYCAIADFMAARKAHYVLGFFNADHSWTQKTYMSFLEKYPYPEDNHFERFETYQIKIAETPNPKDLPEVECRQATKYDLRRIIRFFETTKSPMFCDALGLTSPETLLLTHLSEDYAAVDLYRKRQCFVLQKNNLLIGFAIADVASTGLNVFSLCDSFQIHVVDSASFGEAEEQVLLQTTANWYHTFGKEEALYLAQEKRSWTENHSYISWVVSLNYWIAKSCIFARYKSHIRRLFGRIQTRRNKVREKIRKKKAQ